MLVDTHCHLNMIVQKNFNAPLKKDNVLAIKPILSQAQNCHVMQIVNVGTSLIESKNSIIIARQYPEVFATVGIHPNDCTQTWRNDFSAITQLVHHKKENKIVGIGECGIDRHYPGYNLSRQYDAFKAHINLALEHDLALVIHSRDAYDETLKILEEYQYDIKRGVMHCFSYDRAFADIVTSWNLVLGIGGTVTYPKNNELRAIVSSLDLDCFVLETDAPFLPPQQIRGKQNHPKYINEIAIFIAKLRNQPLEVVAHQTTKTAQRLFKI